MADSKHRLADSSFRPRLQLRSHRRCRRARHDPERRNRGGDLGRPRAPADSRAPGSAGFLRSPSTGGAPLARGARGSDPARGWAGRGPTRFAWRATCGCFRPSSSPATGAGSSTSTRRFCRSTRGWTPSVGPSRRGRRSRGARSTSSTRGPTPGRSFCSASACAAEGDTEESLSARILEEEHRAYPEAIASFLASARKSGPESAPAPVQRWTRRKGPVSIGVFAFPRNSLDRSSRGGPIFPFPARVGSFQRDPSVGVSRRSSRGTGASKIRWHSRKSVAKLKGRVARSDVFKFSRRRVRRGFRGEEARGRGSLKTE